MPTQEETTSHTRGKENTMATATTQTGSKQPPDAQQKIQAFRALFADAPELGKKALENVIAELKSQVSEPRAKWKALAAWAPVWASARS